MVRKSWASRCVPKARWPRRWGRRGVRNGRRFSGGVWKWERRGGGEGGRWAGWGVGLEGVGARVWGGVGVGVEVGVVEVEVEAWAGGVWFGDWEEAEVGFVDVAGEGLDEQADGGIGEVIGKGFGGEEGVVGEEVVVGVVGGEFEGEV